MLSPKFKEKSKTLAAGISATGLAKAWKEKVREDLKRQIIPDPLEYLDFHINYSAICASIANEIHAGSYAVSHVTRITSEKSQGLCRLLVVPDPRDALVLQVIADSLWTDLRNAAPSKNSFYAPKDHAFTGQKKGLEDDYGPIAQWLKFQEKILGFSKTKKYLIVTDIANYYDWIRYSALRPVLSDLINTKEIILDLLIFILKSMIWRPDYMANDDLGLPQCDFDAPRMLAHTFLFEIDGLLQDYPGVEFARYMDDIDIGADSMADARKVLRDLDLTLQSRHIRLNSGKTKILTSKQANDHFCVYENATLDAIEERLVKKEKDGTITSRNVQILGWLMRRWWKAGIFKKGNGSKILKRLVNYSKRFNARLDLEIFIDSFRNNPGMRETLLRYISKSTDPIEFIQSIRDIFMTGEIVDNVTTLRVSTSVISAKYSKPVTHGLIESLIDSFSGRDAFSVLSILLLVSRFGTYKDLKKSIDANEYIWRSEPVVIRGVAGFLPYFRGRRTYRAVYNRVLAVGGRTAAAVFNFYEDMIFGDQFSKVHNFIKAPNPSYINGITHPKFGMLYGYLNNPAFSKKQKADLIAKHAMLLNDYYYGRLISAKMKALK